MSKNKRIEKIGPITVLFSYDVPVAAFNPLDGYLRTDQWYSRTTTRHINSWLEDVDAREVSQDFLNTLAEV